MNKKNNTKGFGLVEAMVAMAIFGVAIISITATMQMAMLSAVKSREQLTSSRLLDMIFSKLKSIDYFFLFQTNSSLPNFFLSTGTFQGTTVYPYRTTLQNIHTIVKNAGFSHYTIDIVFMRRDTSDANGNGLTSDLIAFTDNDQNLIDDYDPTIRYFDQNSDGDYYDTYTLGGRKISEEPDTHLKEVTVKLWKKGYVVTQQTELISLEQFSGIESMASGAALKIFISQPANATFLYNLNTTARQNAFMLAITKSYPSDVTAYRADTFYPLRLWGETSPLAVARFYVNNTSTERDNRTSDMNGLFDFQSAAVTNYLVEGQNRIWARATKDANVSPWGPRDVIVDLNPPTISSAIPTGIVKNRAPRVSAVITDTGISTNTTSGICAEVITLKVNNNVVNHLYDSATGEVVWADTTTAAPIILSTGTYTALLEGGDRAYYKVRSTWSFTVEIEDPDNSAPSIANRSPIGSANTTLPLIQVRVFDNQSGINPASIVLKLNGQVVVNSSNIGSHYDASSGFVSYLPASPFPNGSSHTVEITASHWATTPSDKVTSTDSWNFFINIP